MSKIRSPNEEQLCDLLLQHHQLSRTLKSVRKQIDDLDDSDSQTTLDFSEKSDKPKKHGNVDKPESAGHHA